MRKFAIVFIILVVVGITAISIYLTPDDLGSCSTITESNSCKPADAIIAVSGGNTSARAAEAIRLYQQGWSDTLLFSGAAADDTGPSNAEVMRRQAIEAGVPSENIIVEPMARTTKQNAERTRQLLVEAGGGGAQRVILVTSPYHQRRAGLEFQRLVGDGITIANHPTKEDPDWSTLWWLTPRGWWLAGGELIKIAAFYAGETR